MRQVLTERSYILMDKNNRIQAAAEALGLAEKRCFTLGELERIATEAKCSVHETMWYLRYERRLGK
jgi:hypothetical protein